MQATSIYNYIYFGEVIWYLRNIEDDTLIKEVIEHIDIFSDDLKRFKLPVTERATFNVLEPFKKRLKLKFDENKENTITNEDNNELIEIMKKLDVTLGAEADGNIAFIVTDKRNDINKLLYNMSSLMAPKVFNSLSEQSQYDFKEAGRCIAFEVPTAAAFHLLRGTESVLRDYYKSIIKRNRIKNLMWGPMIAQLRKRKTKPIPPEILLNNLDNIRKSFRNPTQHPDKIYDIQEVQDLLGLCIEVVNRMQH